ncbi:MAG: hypothetical protein QM831_26635 [Kofleriaceae bacterium]
MFARTIVPNQGRTITRLSLPTPSRMVIEPDGGKVVLADAETGEALWADYSRNVAVGPKFIASADHTSSVMRRVNVETGLEEIRPTLAMIRYIAFSSDGTQLAWISRDTPQDYTELFTWGGTSTEIGHNPSALAISDDGRTFVGYGQSIEIGDHDVDVDMYVGHLAITPKGLLAWSDTGDLVLTDPATGQVCWRQAGRPTIRKVIVSPTKFARLSTDAPRTVEWIRIGERTWQTTDHEDPWVDAVWSDDALIIHTANEACMIPDSNVRGVLDQCYGAELAQIAIAGTSFRYVSTTGDIIRF